MGAPGIRATAGPGLVKENWTVSSGSLMASSTGERDRLTLAADNSRMLELTVKSSPGVAVPPVTPKPTVRPACGLPTVTAGRLAAGWSFSIIAEFEGKETEVTFSSFSIRTSVESVPSTAPEEVDKSRAMVSSNSSVVSPWICSSRDW